MSFFHQSDDPVLPVAVLAILFTGAMTVGSIANVIYRARHLGKLANKDIMDKTKESMVI